MLKDKIALVTGASRGVGREIALALAEHGAAVMLSARSKEALEKVRTRIDNDTPGKAMSMPAELTDEQSIKDLVIDIEDRFGKLDILVNCAGITHSASLEETSTEAFDNVMAVNTRGPYILCREALGLLKKSERAFVINISSVVGIKGYPLQSAYTSSKHALRGFSISLAEELRDTNIRVHVISPGGIDTDMVSAVRPDIKKEDLIAPREIAQMVLFLVTQKANAVIDEIRVRRAASAPWF